MPILTERFMSDTFLVTGASKGLGRSIALALANCGKSVIALARSSPELDELYSSLKLVSPNSQIVSCDLASKEDISDAVEIINRGFKHLAGIVHNAGTITPIENMLDVSRESWERAVNVNLIGVQDLTQSLDSLIGGESHTRVLTISSGAAKRPLHGWSSYCVSKAGLDMWTRCLAEEGESENISALAIAPGIVDTGMQVPPRGGEKYMIIACIISHVAAQMKLYMLIACIFSKSHQKPCTQKSWRRRSRRQLFYMHRL